MQRDLTKVLEHLAVMIERRDRQIEAMRKRIKELEGNKNTGVIPTVPITCTQIVARDYNASAMPPGLEAKGWITTPDDWMRS